MSNEKGFFALPEEPAPGTVITEKNRNSRRPISINLPSVQRTWQLLLAAAILFAFASAIILSMSTRYYLLNHGPVLYRIDRWTGKTERAYPNQGWTSIQERPKR